MTDPNIHNISLHGTFDDCQAIVKASFNDKAFRDRNQLAAVNSINWARILAQQVYYVYAYLRVTAAGDATAGKKVSFTVPTGNFGDILAGYYAKHMGLPVDQMVVATNRNDILDRFFTKGDYSLSPNGVAETITPSMDIGISSNFERFLFHRLGENTDEMAALMKNFESTGAFGPTLVTADEIGENEVLTLETRLNGQVMQHATTDMLIFSIPTLIAYCSSFVTLAPGDVIVTGTPGGVGAKRNPPVFMKSGDVVEVEVSKLGVLRNPIRGESA